MIEHWNRRRSGLLEPGHELWRPRTIANMIVPGSLCAPMIAAVAPPYFPKAVDWDGSTNYTEKAASQYGGNSGYDSSLLTVFFWYKFHASPSACIFFTQKFNRAITVTFDGSHWKVVVRNQSNGRSYDISQSSTATNDSTWHSFLCSLSTNFAAGSKLGKIFTDDADDTGAVTDSSAAFTTDYSNAISDVDWILGAQDTDSSAGTHNLKFKGSSAEIMVAPRYYFDLTTTSNRRYFMTSAKKPVDLSKSLVASGVLPDPDALFRGAASGYQNSGWTGNYTLAGSLTDVTGPS